MGKRKPKRVRCWLVKSPYSTYVTMRHADATWDQVYGAGITITPGYFVPDEPKKESKR